VLHRLSAGAGTDLADSEIAFFPVQTACRDLDQLVCGKRAVDLGVHLA